MNSGASKTDSLRPRSSASELSQAELCAMRADGEAWPLGPGHVVVDVPVDVRARLSVLLAGASPGLVVMGLSAAWVWGCLEIAPAKCDVARADGLRLGLSLPETFRVRDVAWVHGDVVAIKTGSVSAIDRTILDIARYEKSLAEESVARVLGNLDAASPGALQASRQRLLDAPHLPYKSLALTRLTSAARYV